MPGNSGENSGPELKPGPVGGMLLAGGVPGNKGGGRPPSAVREKLARVTEKGADWLDAQWDELAPHEKLRAIDIAGKFSIGSKVQVSQDVSPELIEAFRVMLASWFDRYDADLAKELAEDVKAAIQSVKGEVE